MHHLSTPFRCEIYNSRLPIQFSVRVQFVKVIDLRSIGTYACRIRAQRKMEKRGTAVADEPVAAFAVSNVSANQTVFGALHFEKIGLLTTKTLQPKRRSALII